MAGTNIGANPTQAANVDFGGIMNQGLQRLDAKKEQERLAAEREEKKRLDFEDRYGIDEELFTLEDTEFRTVNDTATEAVSLYRDRYYDVYQQLQEDPTNLQLKKRLGKIKGSVTKLGQSTTKIKEIGEEYLEMMKNDELSDVDEARWREILESTDEGRVKVQMDADDNMQYLFYDKSGKLQDVMPFKDLVKGTLTKRVDLDKELGDLVKTIGRSVEDTVGGGFITTTDKFGAPQEKFVNDFIDSYLGTDKKSLEANPVLADLLNQATGGSSKKREGFTEDERQYVKKYLKDRTQSMYGETTKKKQMAQRSAGRAPTAAELKLPRTSDIQVSVSNGAPTTDKNGRLVFTLGKPIAPDAAKSDRMIGYIKLGKDGSIQVAGEERIKAKGEQVSQAQKEIASGKPTNWIEDAMGADGSVTYYRIEPFDEDSNGNPALINKIANMYGVKDADGLTAVLYQRLVDKYDKETADKMLSETTEVPAPQEGKEDKRSSFIRGWAGQGSNMGYTADELIAELENEPRAGNLTEQEKDEIRKIAESYNEKSSTPKEVKTKSGATYK